MTNQKKAYSLMTAIAMIVGVVIGSGIYFKADDILIYAGGNLGLALLSLVVASSGIVFGAMSLTELAHRTSDSGGVANYLEKFVHPALGAAIGFFQAFVYLPSVIAVVCWVAAIYTGQFMGWDMNLEEQILLGFGYLFLLTGLNLFSRQLAGFFQSLTTWVKVVPLILVAAIGLFWTGQTPELPASYTQIPIQDVGWGWLSALVPLAFAYDGWVVVVNIAPEVKNPAKNLPRALIIGPAIILSLYMLYIYGISKGLGESYVMSVGNDAARHFLSLFLNAHLVRLFLLIIVISVLGVANGLLLGCMRLPQAFAHKGWIKSPALARIHPTYQLSLPSSLLIAAVTAFYLLIHYLVTKSNSLPGSDISETTVVFNNTCLIILYLVIIRLHLQGKITNRLTGLIAPIMAIIGGLMLLIGSLMTNFKQVGFFLVICFLSSALGFFLYHTAQKTSSTAKPNKDAV